MHTRTFVRMSTMGLLVWVLILGAGCSSSGTSTGEASQTPAAATINPLVPANTSRDAVNKANDDAAETQKRMDQATTP
jgi:hypothetical protein